jgi:putative oxidoreductase
MGVSVRRLFSTFARGWPGVGLLLIRIVAGVALIINGVKEFQAGPAIVPVTLGLLAVGDGALLIAGLWTPVGGALVLAIASMETLIRHQNPYPSILLAAMGAALALVGPGALSMDAWLFGWKRINLEP